MPILIIPYLSTKVNIQNKAFLIAKPSLFPYNLFMPLDDIRQARVEKLNNLRKAGVDPYPASTARTHSNAQVLESFADLETSADSVTVAGRVLAVREHGGSAFLDLVDGSAKLQIFLKKDLVGEEAYQLLIANLDIGDFLEVTGTAFKTKKAEPTIQASAYKFLVKTLLPLPEKWHGLQDVEERFRKRYLDFIFNPEAKEKIKTRSEVIQTLRNFMLGNNFLEVVTPTLQPIYGGASARPFKTHLHALDIDLFLRIAPELYLKRLLVGGLDRVFEFTTNFRNEGMDRDHNPEFSVLEFYAAYQNLEWLMNFSEELFANLLESVFGNLTIKYQEQEISFQRPFKRARFTDLLKEYTGLDFDADDEKTFRAKAEELKIKIEKDIAKTGLADELFKKVIRPKLVEPIFVHDYPEEMLPLAKKLAVPVPILNRALSQTRPAGTDFNRQATSARGSYVGAFQFYAGGLELIKAFSELNDPLDQRERFKKQENKRAKGDEEAQRMDDDFIEALEYGMPPAAGWGLGIDRLVALLTDSHSIREVILFPLMRPKKEE